MNGELGSSRNNSGTCASPCNGEVEVDYSQLETAEDYQAVAGHLDSLAGDSDVNQASLGIAQFNTGVAATRANFAEFTQVDIANGVFEYRFRESQWDVINAVGTLATAPVGLAYGGAARGAIYAAGSRQAMAWYFVADSVVTTNAILYNTAIRSASLLDDALPYAYQSVRVIKPRFRVFPKERIRVRAGK